MGFIYEDKWYKDDEDGIRELMEEAYTREDFDDLVDETTRPVRILGMTWLASHALAVLDPVAYDQQYDQDVEYAVECALSDLHSTDSGEDTDLPYIGRVTRIDSSLEAEVWKSGPVTMSINDEVRTFADFADYQDALDRIDTVREHNRGIGPVYWEVLVGLITTGHYVAAWGLSVRREATEA